MSKSILVGYDPRTRDRAPVDFGVSVAEFTGAPLIVVAVQAGPPMVPISAGTTVSYAVAQNDADLMADSSGALEDLQSDLDSEGITVRCRTLQSTSAARALHEAADAEDAGLLVVGSSRRAKPERVLLGSTVERLIQGAPCPVAVVPRDWSRAAGINTIGVAYVESPEGREALRDAHALARRAGARLRAITVVKDGLSLYARSDPGLTRRFGSSPKEVKGEHLMEAKRRLTTEVATLGGDVPVEVDAFVGDPAEILIDVSAHLDLLVCGSRRYGPLRAVLLGSVSRRLAAEARCPVIVLPRGVEAALEALLAEAPLTA
jgi:nucleotide-binding universal stress UspA family protein